MVPLDAHRPPPAPKLSRQAVVAVYEPLGQLREALETVVADGVRDGVSYRDVDPQLHAELIVKLLLDRRDPILALASARYQLVRFVLRGLHPHRPAPAPPAPMREGAGSQNNRSPTAGLLAICYDRRTDVRS